MSNKCCSYDVCFVPIVNVTMEDIADPRHPTEKEIEAITRKAAWALLEESEEYINTENLESVTLYEENIEEGPLSSPVPIFGQKFLHVATIIERCVYGDTYASILHHPTAEGLLEKIKDHLQKMHDDRELTFAYEEKRLLDVLKKGSDDNGPYYITVTNWDSEILVSAKIIEL